MSKTRRMNEGDVKRSVGGVIDTANNADLQRETTKFGLLDCICRAQLIMGVGLGETEIDASKVPMCNGLP